MPVEAFNRVADNWRPLFAIAEVAGGDWPARARGAFHAMVADDDLCVHSLGTTLLADIRAIFSTTRDDRLPSARITEELSKIEGRSWAEFGKLEKSITVKQLAKRLRDFGIQPQTIRIGTQTAKGYYLEQFADAFERYLPATASRHTVTKPESTGDSRISETSEGATALRVQNGVSPLTDAGCDGVTVWNIPSDAEAGDGRND